MMPILKLAARSAWARRLTLGVTLASIALSTAMLLSVERIRLDARQSFTQSVTGVDLVVGARTGGVQLMLYSVFHVGQATNNIDWKSFETLASHRAVAWAIPLSLGDSHRGFSVLGTTAAYFTRFHYGDALGLKFRSGQAFANVFETVIGSEVATKLNYRIGDSITLSHGIGTRGLTEHADKPFHVVGILAPTGTPVDRTVHISLESMTALHLDWVAGAPIPGLNIPANFVQKFDLRPKEITSAMIGLKSRADVFRMQRFVNDFQGEPLLAVMPGVALDELWQTIGMVERALFAVSVLVIIVGLAGLVSTMLASLNERRRELAILRSLGAGPRDVFLMLAAEGLLVTTAGAVLGVGILFIETHLAAGWLLEHLGILISSRLLSGTELELVLAVILTGLLASLVPGWRAWRMSLADGLTPRM
jgi:putative ABC transport system permease protein